MNLERLIALRGVKHMRAYLVNHGFSDGEARNLLSGKTKSVRLDLLTRLCEAFECSPNDLLDWRGDAGHVLSQLRKSMAPNIEQLLEGKSPQELEEILRRIADSEEGGVRS
ncbi:MAG: helix-turn-helix domain-containing protein [Flavobacteriales bacterium]|nr:helix-turn-helix domain-containing protein [Flavobacteriales bacterium]